jgi:GntR family histidine utilization transcriptional repressor
MKMAAVADWTDQMSAVRNRLDHRDSATPGPLYQKVKRHMIDSIMCGEWKIGERVSSENELVKEFGISRMTANRALRELAADGLLIRVAGVGTFVADRRSQSHPLQIRDIAEEIKGRGNAHSAKVIKIFEIEANYEYAMRLCINFGSKIFYSLIVNYENSDPIQVEERYINPVAAPDYITQDFNKMTTYEYMMSATPLDKVEHIVEAITPPGDVAHYLQIGPTDPCLLIRRRTWTGSRVAGAANLYHAGVRYKLGASFEPGNGRHAPDH